MKKLLGTCKHCEYRTKRPTIAGKMTPRVIAVFFRLM